VTIDDDPRPQPKPRPGLVCQECGEEADVEAHGWRAYLNDRNEPVFYCAVCAEREFGDD
jgi:hypothetical protein